MRRVLFDVPLLFLRGERDRALYVLRDRCPHRGAPLSSNSVCPGADVPLISCPYHGWQFEARSGACVFIPALSETDPVSAGTIHVEVFKIREQNGLVWIFRDTSRQPRPGDFKDGGVSAKVSLDDQFDLSTLQPRPSRGPLLPRSVTVVDAPGAYDEAVTGLVDAAHTPFVHRQWWWRAGRAAREKHKSYVPLSMGFRIPFHEPSGNSRIYGLLGGKPQTQIDFFVPGVRVETIHIGGNSIVGLTAITPVTRRSNRITHVLFWDTGLLTLLKPVVDAMAASFLSQDGRILTLQSANCDGRTAVPRHARRTGHLVPAPGARLAQAPVRWRAEIDSKIRFLRPVCAGEPDNGLSG